MDVIFLGIINAVIWTFISIRWKELRNKNISSKTSFGLLCFGVPFWLLTLIYLFFNSSIYIDLNYILMVLGWLFLAAGTNLLVLYIMKFKALSELAIYRLVFSTFFGFIVDIVLFDTIFNFLTLIGIVLLFSSGIILSKNKNNLVNRVDLKFLTTLGLLVLIGIMGIIQFSLYKLALGLQENVLVHVVLSQVMLFSTFFIVSFKDLKKDYSLNLINKYDFLFFGFLIYLYTIIEGLLFKELPITIIFLLTVLNLLAYAVYDIKKDDYNLNWKTYLSGVLILTGLVLISFS